MSWAKRWTGYVGDTALDAGIGWFATCSPVRMGRHWRGPVRLHRWRIDLDLWPLFLFCATWRSPRQWRGLTYVQTKWRVYQALEEMKKDER